MKTGLFFGSFNPIHTGHLIIAEYFMNTAALDRVKFVVSPHNPLKPQQDLMDAGLRLKMTELSIADNPAFEADDLEFGLPLPSYTYLTLEHLKLKYPDDEFFLIIGSDTLETIDRWKNHEAILQHNILVYKRNENIANPFPEKENIRIFDSPVLNISATGIREMLVRKQSVKYLVRDEIIGLLKKEL